MHGSPETGGEVQAGVAATQRPLARRTSGAAFRGGGVQGRRAGAGARLPCRLRLPCRRAAPADAAPTPQHTLVKRPAARRDVASSVCHPVAAASARPASAPLAAAAAKSLAEAAAFGACARAACGALGTKELGEGRPGLRRGPLVGMGEEKLEQAAEHIGAHREKHLCIGHLCMPGLRRRWSGRRRRRPGRRSTTTRRARSHSYAFTERLHADLKLGNKIVPRKEILTNRSETFEKL